MPFTSGSFERTFARIARPGRPGAGEHLARVGADRHGSDPIATWFRAGPGPRPSRRPSRWHRDHELVRCELGRLPRAALLLELVGKLGVGRRVDVRLHSLPDLCRQLVGTGEREAHVGTVETPDHSWSGPPSWTMPQRRRAGGWTSLSSPPHPATASSASGASQRRALHCALHHDGGCLHRRRWPRPPAASPSSSTASRVIAAVIRCGPASISTTAITPSACTDRDDARKAVASRQRIARLVAIGMAAQPLDLTLSDPAPVARRRAWCAACPRVPSA